MEKLTQTSIPQRIRDAGYFASGSAVLLAFTQLITRERIEQILLSSGADFGQTFITSFTNGSIYNFLKQKIHYTTHLPERTIILSSIALVSILGVGAPKFIIHSMAGTNNPEALSLLYTIGNMVVMWLYEKHILQKRT